MLQRGCGSLQTLSQVCIPLNQRLGAVWIRDRAGGGSLPPTLCERKAGDFPSEWDSRLFEHFWNVLHVGVGWGHFPEVHITGSDTHSSSKGRWGDTDLGQGSGDLKTRKRFHWILEKALNYGGQNDCYLQGHLGAGSVFDAKT